MASRFLFANLGCSRSLHPVGRNIHAAPRLRPVANHSFISRRQSEPHYEGHIYMANLHPSFHLERSKRSVRPDMMIILAALAGLMMVLWAALTPVKADESVRLGGDMHGRVAIVSAM